MLKLSHTQQYITKVLEIQVNLMGVCVILQLLQTYDLIQDLLFQIQFHFQGNVTKVKLIFKNLKSKMFGHSCDGRV